MNETIDYLLPQLDTRTEPTQRRSVERLELLLDTAAAIIEEHGLNHLTTSEVAAKSRSSVGAVYRYFPNIDSLLVALANRNIQRYRDRLMERVSEFGLPDWKSLVRQLIRTYADLADTVPGFRAIRFGDPVMERSGEIDPHANEDTVRQFGTVLIQQFGFRTGIEFDRELRLIVEVGDALTRHATVLPKEQVEALIERTIEIQIGMLTPFAPAERTA